MVLTTSAVDEDILHAYRQHVNSYIRKPVRLDELIRVVCSIDEYWLGIVALPPRLGAPADSLKLRLTFGLGGAPLYTPQTLEWPGRRGTSPLPAGP